MTVGCLSPRKCDGAVEGETYAADAPAGGSFSRRASAAEHPPLCEEGSLPEAKLARLASTAEGLSPFKTLLLPSPVATLARQGSLAAYAFGGTDSPVWSPEDSAAVYNVGTPGSQGGWGCGYFEVGPKGTLLVRPLGEAGPAVDLHALVRDMASRGLRMPCVFRFLDILGNRMDKLSSAFDAAIERFEYQGCYRGVFPVKCNHDKDVIQTVVDHGRGRGFGLEVGSKAELLMVMSMLAGGPPGTTLVCNGYKDDEYMELVLRSRQLGINAIVVLEQYSELDILLGVASRLRVRPVIGIRAKLTTRHGGHWGSTSGDRAKFGLRPREIVAVVNVLSDEGMLDCLQLLHFHCGSQITNIRMVKEVMREASYLYAELVQMGAAMRFMDVGGGLAIDYDGSFTDTTASMAYSLQHYANDVVSAVMEACTLRGIAPPTLMSESGRALASHHSIVVFDVLTRPDCEVYKREKQEEQEEVVDSIEIRDDRPLTKQLRAAAAGGRGRFLLTTFKEVYDNISADALALREAYNDASYFREEAVRAFKLGVLGLEDRAQVDVMFDAVAERIREVARENELPLPDALRPDAVPRTKSYHVNLSVFRSAVDTWAIQQVFPIMPIHRLQEEPTVAATLADLTCDSDGKIDRFINPKGGEALPALPLHEVRLGEPYYLAMFLTGVYQETMGSVGHNMFGSLNQVVVRVRRDSCAPSSIPAALASVPEAAPAASSDGSCDTSVGGMHTDSGDSSPTAQSRQGDAEGDAAAAAARGPLARGDSDSSMAAAAGGASDGDVAAAPVPVAADACCLKGGVCGGGGQDYWVERVVQGESMGEVLSRANHRTSDMVAAVAGAVDAAVAAGRMEGHDAAALLDDYTTRMSAYTYMRGPREERQL